MAQRPDRRAALNLLAASLLAGCAVGGPLAPPAADGAPARPLAASGFAAAGSVATATAAATATATGSAAAAAEPERVPGATGEALALSAWVPEAPRAVILAVHGFADYGPSTFADAATAWAGRGIATYAFDQRGFGRNRSRGYWPGAEGLVADLRAVARAIRARHPCLPLVVLGHSMGGGVVLAAAPGLEADAIVLAAPAIWGGDALNPLHRAAAWIAAATVPERRFTGRGVVRIRPTDNDEVLRRLARDPLYLGPPSAREIMGLVRVTDLAAAAAEAVRLPALLLLGERDEIVPNDRVEAVFGRIGGPRTVIRYPEGWHLLFRDLQAARVWSDVADWTHAAAPGAACPARIARTG